MAHDVPFLLRQGQVYAESARWLGVIIGPALSSATFYKWKAKFDGMDVSDARRLKMLETENARL